MIPLAWAVRNCRYGGPARRGAGSMPAAVRISHRGGGDSVAGLDQFTWDAPMPPAGIVLGHAHDECLGRHRGWPPSRVAPVAVIPCVGHQRTVPGEHGGRRDREDLPPAVTGDQVRATAANQIRSADV